MKIGDEKMGLIMRDGNEVRAPGRAVPEAHRRKGILGIADAMPLGEFRKMPAEHQAIFLKDALKAKGEFEKSAKYHEALIRGRFGADGIKAVLIKAACKTAAEMQSRLPSHGYHLFWIRNGDIFDMEDAEASQLNPKIGANEMPFTARAVQLTVSLDGTKAAFTTREIIDCDPRGRQIRWKAFLVGADGAAKEIAGDHAYEAERPVIMKIAEVRQSGFVLETFFGKREV